MWRVGAVAFAAMIFSAFASEAATLSPGTGKLSADLGDGFRTITVDTVVPPGTRVMVSPGGEAQIRYENNCYARVKPGLVYIVEEAAICPASQNTNVVNPDFVPPANMTTGLILGGLAVGGGVGIALALSGDDDKDTSP